MMHLALAFALALATLRAIAGKVVTCNRWVTLIRSFTHFRVIQSLKGSNKGHTNIPPTSAVEAVNWTSHGDPGPRIKANIASSDMRNETATPASSNPSNPSNPRKPCWQAAYCGEARRWNWNKIGLWANVNRFEGGTNQSTWRNLVEQEAHSSHSVGKNSNRLFTSEFVDVFSTFSNI